MAKFFRCWVIVAGSQPTAFRSRDAEELIPTLKQLQRTQPDVSLMWYEYGRFWPSPDAARQAQTARRSSSSERGRDWRPGGNHKDPKARPVIPRDVKRARFKKRLISERIRESGGSTEGRPPRGDKPSPWERDKPKPGGSRGGFGGRGQGPGSFDNRRSDDNRRSSTNSRTSGGRPGPGGKPSSGNRPPASGRPPSGGRPASGGRPPSGSHPSSGGRSPAGNRPPGGNRPPSGSRRPPSGNRPPSGGRPPSGRRPAGGRPPRRGNDR